MFFASVLGRWVGKVMDTLSKRTLQLPSGCKNNETGARGWGFMFTFSFINTNLKMELESEAYLKSSMQEGLCLRRLSSKAEIA